METDGWTFNWNGKSGRRFRPDWQKYCEGVPKTSYCGYRSKEDGIISYTFSDSGSATLKYGQSYSGSVHVKKNNEEIGFLSNRGISSITFKCSSGDVLQIEEIASVINIHSLTLESIGKHRKNKF